MTPYSLSPVGDGGADHSRSVIVEGPLACDPLSVARLHQERDLWKRRAEQASFRADRAEERIEEESQLRLQAQARLNSSMRFLAVLARTMPELRTVIDQARKDIFDG